MEPIAPRWEWRTFFAGGAPAAVIERLGDPRSEPEESDELYILSNASRKNVKVRRGQLEIKTLDAVERGLERWRPTLKTSFPLGETEVRAMCEALGLRLVTLHKRRRRFTIDGCAAEHATLDVNGARWDTIAVEDVDADRVHRAIAALKLESLANSSYPAALKAIVGSDVAPILPAAL